jgi:hypothetical protein
VTSVAGHESHQMEFVSESYGGGKGSKKKASNATKTAEKREEVLDEDHSNTVTSPDPAEVVVEEPTPLALRELPKYATSTRKLTKYGYSTRELTKYARSTRKRSSMVCMDSDEEIE